MLASGEGADRQRQRWHERLPEAPIWRFYKQQRKVRPACACEDRGKRGDENLRRDTRRRGREERVDLKRDDAEGARRG
jgi:hypothetical protein